MLDSNIAHNAYWDPWRRLCSRSWSSRTVGGSSTYLESVFEIIAEPNRRAILGLLVSSQQSVGEIERQLRMPQPTVSKHLKALREAGLVVVRPDAQRRWYQLRSEPLRELDAWLEPYRAAWSARFDALARHLDQKEDR